jgi:hypothetical protein
MINIFRHRLRLTVRRNSQIKLYATKSLDLQDIQVHCASHLNSVSRVLTENLHEVNLTLVHRIYTLFAHSQLFYCNGATVHMVDVLYY